ncbi:MAG TPA: hypothetical protein VMZ30_17500 [Pyrinomonadaceae bacterium]|nr:hypothetical protein [Pyrinomonadaceae bacterium]
MKNLSSCSTICFSIILVTFSFPVTAQTTNPRWISEMPAPERILREIKGKDAADTAERQMGAFKHLMEIIDSMAYGLEHRFMPNKATPDENRIKDMYWKAYADVWYKAKNKNDNYIHDGDLHDEMMEKFFSKGFRELLLKSDKNRSAIYDKHREESAGTVFTVGPKDQSAGAPNTEELLTGGLKKLIKGLKFDPPAPGLLLRGFYKTPNFYANFWSERFMQVGCSGVNRNSSYTLERKGGEILVHIENDDDTVTLALRPDLALVGPGPLAIHGFVPGGSTTTTTPGEAHQVTTTTQVQMNRTDVIAAGQQQNATQTGAQTYSVPQTTTSTEYTPPTTTTTPAPYIPKTIRCMAGTITPEPAAKPSNAPREESTGLLKVVEDSLGGEEVFVPNGLRMGGTYYGQGGANIEFLDHKAIVGCHVTRDENPYTVAFRNGEVIVNVEGAGAPLAFKLDLDGTLVGNGASIPIYGQKVVGKNQQGDPVYAASSDSCAYGTLAPQGENPASSTAARDLRVNPTPATTNARPSAPVTPSVTNARPASPTTPSAVGSLAILNGFAGENPNRFGNVSLIVVKQSFEDILRNTGFGNATGRQSAIANWSEMCKAQSPRCKQGTDAMKDSYLRMIKLGPNGNVSFANVPAQTMWLVAIVPYGNQHFVWNLRVDVRAGTNSITFDKSNLAAIY